MNAHTQLLSVTVLTSSSNRDNNPLSLLNINVVISEGQNQLVEVKLYFYQPAWLNLALKNVSNTGSFVWSGPTKISKTGGLFLFIAYISRSFPSITTVILSTEH